MQQLLTGKKRLPGFSEEWNKLPVEKFVELGKTKFDSKNKDQNHECIELEHIEQGTGQLIGSTKTQYTESAKSIFQKDDVLFGKLRPYLRKYWCADRSGVCSTEIWVLKARNGAVLPQYLFQLVQTDHFVESANISSGTHMPRADWKVVKGVSYTIPSLNEQQKIASVLFASDKEIEALQKKLAYFHQEKKALMQQLLTGKRRVKVDGNNLQGKIA